MSDRVRSRFVGGIVAMLVIGFVILLVMGAAKRAPTGQYDWLLNNGIPARGILLMVASTGTKMGTPARRYEVRQVRIDIEIPGREPYEVNATPAIPINLVRDVLPGATVELRVDPRNPSNIAIVGPGTGFVQQALRTA
jgi:hypothetical protein